MAEAPDLASIVQAADAFDRIQLNQDQAALDQMILDDFVFIDGSGKRFGKTDFIAGWMAPGDRYDPITLIDRTITPSAGTPRWSAPRPACAASRTGHAFAAECAFPIPSSASMANGEWPMCR